MSVSYYLRKGVRLKDIKEKGFTVLEGEDAGSYQIVIESKTYYTDKETGQGSWVGTWDCFTDDEGERIITNFEGHSGFSVMWELHEKLGVDYITDNEVDELIYQAEEKGSDEIVLTDELFDNYMKKLEEKMSK